MAEPERRSTPPGKGISYWTDTTPDYPLYSPLAGEAEADVAIIGGGIAGIATALLMARAGLKVTVLESRRIGGQVTAGSTVKITSQHGVIYRDLIERFGLEGARLYADANQWGLLHIGELIDQLGIECDFRRCANYVYTELADHAPHLRNEADAAIRLGLPAFFTETLELPFPTKAAVGFSGQAQLHPRRFTLGLAEAVARTGGCTIHEDSRVLSVDEGQPCAARTERGVLRAAHVVVTTNLPILDRGGFFAKAFPRRHVVMAATLKEGTKAPDGMFMTVEQPTRSFRFHDGPDGSVLIAVGDGFKTGHADAGEKFRTLEAWLRGHFPIDRIGWHWGNEDYDTADRVPYVGRLTPMSRHLWTATGFGAWGFTNSMAAARMLTDAMTGRHNPWLSLFDATRVRPRHTGGRIIKQNVHVAREWFQGRLSRPPQKNLDGIAPGSHAFISGHGGLVGAYRDDNGGVHMVSPTCTHMGCRLVWNGAEKSWDCPCHGSRFDMDGKVLHGPAVRDLPQPDVD